MNKDITTAADAAAHFEALGVPVVDVVEVTDPEPVEIDTVVRGAAETVGRSFKAALAAKIECEDVASPTLQMKLRARFLHEEYEKDHAAFVDAFPGVDPLAVFYAHV